jgi:hypothetical protein
MTLETYSSSKALSPKLRNENMIGVIDLNILSSRIKTLKKRVGNKERMDWSKYEHDCLNNMKLRESKNIKSLKKKISYLLMEFEAAEKVDQDAD